MSKTKAERLRRRAAVADVASRQGNLIGRRQLYALGCTRSELRAELQAARWKARGKQCVQVGDPDRTTQYWRALLEVGPSAVVDGISALILAGLRTITANEVHVEVPQGAWYRRCKGVRVHETRRFREADVVRAGIPRTRPATAAVHAALWARSDLQAALFLVASVQQGLVSVPKLTDAVNQVKRHRRRRLLQGVLLDVSDGIESVDERNFARACRRRQFPKSTRQEVVQLPSGRVRYDVYFDDYDLKVEIEGAQHLDAAMAMADTLKQNAAAISGNTLLRFPNFAFRANPEPFLDQMAEVFRARGWAPPQRQGKRAA